MKEQGTSTLAARKIWFDDVVQRLNADGRGTYLGQFSGSDKIIAIYQKGYYKTTGFDLSTHFDEDLIAIEKFHSDMVITAVYWEGEKQQYNVKRFHPEVAQKAVTFITEHPDSMLDYATTHPHPKLKLQFDKRSNEREDELIDLTEFIAVKGLSAMGNRLTPYKIKSMERIEPEVEVTEPAEEPVEEPEASHVAPSESDMDGTESPPSGEGGGTFIQPTLF
jgi:topoisomerase-4 subunit A